MFPLTKLVITRPKTQTTNKTHQQPNPTNSKFPPCFLFPLKPYPLPFSTLYPNPKPLSIPTPIDSLSPPQPTHTPQTPKSKGVSNLKWVTPSSAMKASPVATSEFSVLPFTSGPTPNCGSSMRCAVVGFDPSGT